MDEKAKEGDRPRINRRKFVGALGAAAAAGAFLPRGQSATAGASQVYYYQDSFGNIVPAGQGAIDLGVYPPPVPATATLPANAANPGAAPETQGATAPTSPYPIYNILLIVVDQMRNPAFWLPSGNNWVSTYAGVMPNITQLAKWSFLFPNYFVAATVCTPSRACLLTGLYSQQTCIFKTSAGGLTPPPLLKYNNNWSPGGSAGFPTIGNVLTQPLISSNNAYNCAWIGKWHLSCQSGLQDGIPGANGPSDYGFNSSFNLPTASTTNLYPGGQFGPPPHHGYPSPDGVINGGAGGDFLDSYTQSSPQTSAHDVPGWSQPLPVTPIRNYVQLNDAAIATAFTNYWLPNANTTLNSGNPAPGSHLTTPWFCAVSFINPHDINDFPWPFAITSSGSGSLFLPPSNPPTTGYQPAPVLPSNNNYSGNDCYNNACSSDGDVTTIQAFPGLYATPLYATLPPGTGSAGPWNWEPLSAKPGLQQFFQNYYSNIHGGAIQAPGAYNSTTNTWSQPTAWTTFLNYYAWLQSCVDYQIGWVLGTNPESGQPGLPSGLKQNSSFWNNTVIIFTSDHGDFGGSHGLHSKGGALYDEVLNVPLMISYPGQRTNNQQSPTLLPYVCSSVDLLPYLYTLALGNYSWRNNNNDMVYYLAGREAIHDAIFQYANNNYTGVIQQRRISGIPLYVPFGSNNWETYQPFVLHTTDEYSAADLGNGTNHNYQPSHAIAFRTVDQTETNNNAAPFAGQTTYGGGKLGVYSFWDTVDATVAPIKAINNSAAPNQYEFYNYSPHLQSGNANPQEMGNQYSTGSGSLSQAHYNDFFNTGNNNGINIQNELYNLNNNGSTGNNILQVQAAIQTAFSNFILYLECSGNMTGNNGQPANSSSGVFCPPNYSA